MRVPEVAWRSCAAVRHSLAKRRRLGKRQFASPAHPIASTPRPPEKGVWVERQQRDRQQGVEQRRQGHASEQPSRGVCGRCTGGEAQPGGEAQQGADGIVAGAAGCVLLQWVLTASVRQVRLAAAAAA